MSWLAAALVCLAALSCCLAQEMHPIDQSVISSLNSAYGLGLTCDSNRLGCNFEDPIRVTRLNLAFLELEGTIPTNLGQLAALESLQLNNNEFTGFIPTELGLLRSLSELNLDFNIHLEGVVPTFIANAVSLQHLSIASCDLRGAIPTELGRLTSLRILDLSGNRAMQGTLPTHLGQLRLLEELRIQGLVDFGQEQGSQVNIGNLIGGFLPTQLGLLTNLRVMWLERNRLEGPIPTQFGNLQRLEDMFLHSNRLTGHLPTQLARLNNLRRLLVSDNFLTGPIPPFLQAESAALDFRGTANRWDCPLPTWCAPERCSQRCTCVGGTCGLEPNDDGCFPCFNCTLPSVYGPNCDRNCLCEDNIPDLLPYNTTCLSGTQGNGSCLMPNGTLYSPPQPPTPSPTPFSDPNDQDLEQEEDDRRKRQTLLLSFMLILVVIIIVLIFVAIICYAKRTESHMASRLADKGLRPPVRDIYASQRAREAASQSLYGAE